MAKQKMSNMTAYNSGGYVPPKGSAGAEAKGAFENKSNPKSVPRKGSSIQGDMGSGNSDRAKVMSQKNAQAMNEKLRGQSGC